MSFIQAQSDALRQANEIYQRMQGIAFLAADPTIGQDERDLLTGEFESLRLDSLVIAGSTINGIPLMDPRAAGTQYDISFTEGATSNDPASGGIMADGTFVSGATTGNRMGTSQPYWDVQKDVLYNSGEVSLKLKPYTMWDRFVLYQDDPSNYIFDTGEWQGDAFDQFVVKYGPDQTTSFAFTTTNNYSNKNSPGTGYLGKFGLTDDRTSSGMQDYYEKEVSNLGQVTTRQPNLASSLLTLRVIGGLGVQVTN
jgi:flagellin-like hook-associated protein FlgL